MTTTDIKYGMCSGFRIGGIDFIPYAEQYNYTKLSVVQ
jgi:hypothetical protein